MTPTQIWSNLEIVKIDFEKEFTVKTVNLSICLKSHLPYTTQIFVLFSYYFTQKVVVFSSLADFKTS
jgi:hypothetical protein